GGRDLGGHAQDDRDADDRGGREHRSEPPGVDEPDREPDEERQHRDGDHLRPTGHAEAGAVVANRRSDRGQVEDPGLEARARAGEARRGADEEDRGGEAGDDDADAADGDAGEPARDPHQADDSGGRLARRASGHGGGSGSGADQRPSSHHSTNAAAVRRSWSSSWSSSTSGEIDRSPYSSPRRPRRSSIPSSPSNPQAATVSSPARSGRSAMPLASARNSSTSAAEGASRWVWVSATTAAPANR